MLRMKQKKEAKAKAEAEAAAAALSSNATLDGPDSAPTEQPQGGGQMSLFGIGGAMKTATNKPAQKQKCAGEIRIQKDIGELEVCDVAEVRFPNPNKLTKFELYVTPDSGYWKGAKYRFTFDIPPSYPHDPPKVLCHPKIYHPNINLDGKVCLNILREDWKPVLAINHVIHGLIYLFYEPNHQDPLNHEAAEVLRNNRREFERTVSQSLRGGYIKGEQFERLI